MVFISYSHSDIIIARQVEKRLRGAGISCWFDESQIPVGERFVVEIGSALHKASVFLVIDSESAAASYWVNREIQAAERLRTYGNLRAIVVFSTSPSHFLPCEPDARAASPELVANTVDSLFYGTSPKAQHGTAYREAVRIIDWDTENARWLGFSQELENLDRWWFGRSPGMWISGPGGSGKTSLVRTWLRAFQQIGYREQQSAQALFVHVNGHYGADAILQEIADAFFYSIGMNYEQSSQDDMALRLACALRDREERGLLVINSPEEMDELELLKAIHTALQSGLRIIITARNSLSGQLQANFDSFALSQMSNIDTRLLVNQLFPQQQADPIAARLIDALGGNPLAISLAMKKIQKSCSPSERAQASEDLLRFLARADVNR